MTRKLSRRSTMLAAGVAAAALATAGAAGAASMATPSNAARSGHGINQFGLTEGATAGKTDTFRYTKGFTCDTSISSKATSGCEAGEKWKKAPAGHHDTLFITVPLGFTVPHQECPANLACVDHPGTIDLTRLAGALKPLYPKAGLGQLKAMLRNVPVPGHDHFLTTDNGGKPEWWDVKVIGVLNKNTYDQIAMSHDYATVQKLLDAKNKNVVGPIDTNLFLFFASH